MAFLTVNASNTCLFNVLINMAHHNMGFATDEYDHMESTELPEQIYPQETSSTPSVSQQKPSGCFTFVDFCPEYRRKADSWFFQAEYETFRFALIALITMQRNLLN